MANIWQPNPSMNERESEAMACILEARHGRHAAEVADFFATLHDGNGDDDRSGVWADVAECVRERELQRLQQD